MEKTDERTLLIVDDVALNRDILKAVLEDEYTVIEARGGREALRILERFEDAVSAVLLDIMMPDMNGLDVLKAIQEDPVLSMIPIIIVSSASEMDYGLRAIELGANDYINKPIDPVLVKLRVKSAIAKREVNELRAQN